MKKTIMATAICGLMLTGGLAQAKEGGDQYPNGGETWFAGAVPPPGNYFINYYGYYSGKLKDAGGNNVNQAGDGGPANVNSSFASFRFLQTTKQTLLGGNWSWHVIVPVVDLEIDRGGEAGASGVGDITFSPLILAWHGSEWHTVAALDINLPTGKYDKNDPRKSIGANYYSFEPVLGFSYLPKSGWEVSAKFMYNIKTENNDTDYQSGDEFHVDYLIGKHIGNWGIGLNGYYLKQVTDDKKNGSTYQDGYRGQVFAYGPSIKYTNKSGTHFIAQWQHETMVENRFGGDKYWLKMIMPL